MQLSVENRALLRVSTDPVVSLPALRRLVESELIELGYLPVEIRESRVTDLASSVMIELRGDDAADVCLVAERIEDQDILGHEIVADIAEASIRIDWPDEFAAGGWVARGTVMGQPMLPFDAMREHVFDTTDPERN